MSKKRLIRSIGQNPVINWEKGRPIGPERTSDKASDF